MSEYCAYLIGKDGHIQHRIELICADDDAAKECADLLVDDCDSDIAMAIRSQDRDIRAQTVTDNSPAIFFVRTGWEDEKWLFIDCCSTPLWGRKRLAASQRLTSKRCIPSASRIATTP